MALVCVIDDIGVVASFCLYQYPPPLNGDGIGLFLLCVGCCGGSLYTALYLLRCRAIADTNGLTIRSIWREINIPWPQLEDYEYRNPPAGKEKTAPIIFVKTAGQWFPLPRDYEPYKELVLRIQREARWSQSKVWQRNDLRDDGEWPKIFSYHSTSHWLIWGKYLPLHLGTWAFCLLPLVAMREMTLNKRLVSVAILFVFFGLFSLGALIISWSKSQELRATRDRLGEKLIATRKGLTYIKGANELSIPWEEIKSVNIDRLPGRFSTVLLSIETRGGRIKWLPSISGHTTLEGLLQERAKIANLRPVVPPWEQTRQTTS